MRAIDRAKINKANNNPNLTLRELVEANAAQFSDPSGIPVKPHVATAGIPENENEEIDNLINLRMSKEVRAAVAEISYCSPETILAVCNDVYRLDSNYEWEVKDVLAELIELQKGYDAAMATALTYTARAASDAFRQHKAECEDTTLKTNGVTHCDGKTLEMFELEFRHKFESSMRLTKTFSPKATELVSPYIYGFVKRIRDMADTIAEREQELCKQFHIPWEVSKLTALKYRVAEIIEQHGGRGHDPKSCASFLNLSNPIRTN